MNNQDKINYLDKYATGLRRLLSAQSEMDILSPMEVTGIVAEIQRVNNYVVKLKRKS